MGIPAMALYVIKINPIKIDGDDTVTHPARVSLHKYMHEAYQY
jgi:hypothetical protein